MNRPSVVVVDAPGVAEAVASCWSTAVVRDRDGKEGRGFLNLKRLLGKPDQFRLVVKELAQTVAPGVPVAACDKGAWSLVGALVLALGTPGVLVRPDPKKHFVAYGDDPAFGNERLAGERLDPGTNVHLIDDVIYSGETIRSAASALTSAGLIPKWASVVVGANTAERVAAMVRSTPLERITCLVLATDLCPCRATAPPSLAFESPQDRDRDGHREVAALGLDGSGAFYEGRARRPDGD